MENAIKYEIDSIGFLMMTKIMLRRVGWQGLSENLRSDSLENFNNIFPTTSTPSDLIISQI